MAAGYGIARIVEPNSLEVEFEIRDCFEATKSAARTIIIPIDKLSSAKFQPGFFSNSIQIQSESIHVVSEIPGSQQGSVRLYTKKADEETARRFVDHLHRLIPGYETTPSPVPPTKSFNAAHATAAPTAGQNRIWDFVQYFFTVVLVTLMRRFIAYLKRLMPGNEAPQSPAPPTKAHSDAQLVPTNLRAGRNRISVLAQYFATLVFAIVMALLGTVLIMGAIYFSAAKKSDYAPTVPTPNQKMDQPNQGIEETAMDSEIGLRIKRIVLVQGDSRESFANNTLNWRTAARLI
jgi:hypothetical protein